MNYVKLLLAEGRREDLIEKYSDDFGPSLMLVLDDDFSKSTNYKYVDWIFSNVPKKNRTTQPSIDKGLKLVKEFDKIKSNLTKKDINQYDSIEELDSVVNEYQTKKGPEPKVEKIYEDEKFVVLIPKNEAASCKYGANTKWCVTMRGSGYFENYTMGAQMLYFIINKANSTDKVYSKVAIHYNGIGHPTYWDSRNNVLGNKEIHILKYAFPEIFDVIENHYGTKAIKKDWIKVANDTFSNFGQSISIEKNIFETDKDLYVVVKGFDLISDMGMGHSYGSAYINISDENTNETKKIDSYELLITYNVIKSYENNVEISVTIGFSGEDGEKFDTGLEQLSIKHSFDLIQNSELNSRNIKEYVAKEIMNKLKKDYRLKKFIKSFK